MEMLDQFAKNWYKTGYYTKGMLRNLLPDSYWQRQLARLLADFESASPVQKEYLLQRVNYYNKLTGDFQLPDGLDFDHQLYKGKRSTAYAMDFSWWLSFFSGFSNEKSLSYSYLFGDIVHVPDTPTFLKSRPIMEDAANENSVLLKLNQIRHYYTVKDKARFEQKIPKMVWRGRSNHPDRVTVLSRYYENPLCDVGDTHYPHKRTVYVRPFMSIPEQLRYRYVLSVEGNDVATNLKWIMASNSLCFMRNPRFETWFMEGSLVPGVHYVQLRDDHSDIEEKITYYNAHPKEAESIIANANRYVEQFSNQHQELIITLLVMQKYFRLSGQLQQG
ncbi:glycosyl transferase family 90 [Cellvibrio sp. NN19]|uniref:glycosyl transferase family 90 n=1 Tax=Cellvibrio chitinivorans TaxID=3102792 RepID=UPI002B40A76E|nr:glycosyl transferase family 90 [Cellvibrio sp. NN19]